jgi:hypothetical protein
MKALEMADNCRRIFYSSPFVKRFGSGSFGQKIAVAITVASSALPLDNSLPHWHTNSMNSLYAEERFGQP